MLLRNVTIHLQHYMLSQLRSPQFEYSRIENLKTYNIKIEESSRSASSCVCLYFSLLSVTTQQLSKSHSRRLCKMSLLVIQFITCFG
jgi:hypothetical protein